MTDQLIGCTRLVDVTTVPMFRPSNRVPFGVFCKVHRNRLIRHNCCPTCGVFCTQVSEQNFVTVCSYRKPKYIILGCFCWMPFKTPLSQRLQTVHWTRRLLSPLRRSISQYWYYYYHAYTQTASFPSCTSTLSVSKLITFLGLIIIETKVFITYNMYLIHIPMFLTLIYFLIVCKVF